MYWINSKIFTALLSVLFVWALFSVIFAEVKKGEVKKEEAAIENKLSNVRSNNEALERYLGNLKNPDFLEKEVRFRLNYKASGEEVVFVHRDANSQKASLSTELSEELPNHKKWWYWFLGN